MHMTDEKGKSMLKKMFEILVEIRDNMTAIQSSLEETLDKHKDVIAFKELTSAEAKMDAILDISADLARAQVALMRMSHVQMESSIKQMGDIFDVFDIEEMSID